MKKVGGNKDVLSRVLCDIQVGEIKKRMPTKSRGINKAFPEQGGKQACLARLKTLEREVKKVKYKGKEISWKA